MLSELIDFRINIVPYFFFQGLKFVFIYLRELSSVGRDITYMQGLGFEPQTLHFFTPQLNCVSSSQ